MKIFTFSNGYKYIGLTRVQSQTNLAKEAPATLKTFGFPILQTHVPLWQDFQYLVLRDWKALTKESQNLILKLSIEIIS